jgi:hypothetical protein
MTIVYSASIIWSYLSLRSTVFRDVINIERTFIKECLDTKLLLKIIDDEKLKISSI